MQKTSGAQAAGGKRLFLSGILSLGAANMVVKIIGLLFKIPMSYYLGDEGMGYFNSAYQIYTWFYMLSTAGLPVAVSILVSESRAWGNARRVRRILRLSFLTFLLLGILGMAIMLLGADAFAALIGAPDSRYAIMAIAPTLFFICISSALRGYFQGFQQMGPPALSQVMEALGKLLVGVALAIWATGQGYSLPMIAAFAVVGLGVGEAAGMAYLLISRRRYERDGRLTVTPVAGVQEAPEAGGLLARLFRIALPVTVSASVMSLTSLIDLVLIQRRLQSIGYTVGEATAFYGNYTTLAVPMFNLPPALIYPLATVITPLLAATLAAGNRARAGTLAASVLRVASLIAMPCALGLSVFSLPVLRLFFREDMAAAAAPLLSVLAPAVVFLSLLSVTNAILQAGGQAGKPTVSMLVGGGVKLLASYILIGIPAVGTVGVPLSTLLCYLVAMALNLFFTARRTGALPSPLQLFVRPLLASALSVGAGLGLYLLLGGDGGSRLVILPVILLTALIYAAAVLLLRCVTEEDVRLLPGGDRLARLLQKKKLLT